MGNTHDIPPPLIKENEGIEFSYYIFNLHISFPDIYITIVCLIVTWTSVLSGYCVSVFWKCIVLIL